MSTERDDKRTLGVTPAGQTLLAAIMDTGWFGEEIDAYRLAISLAFAHELVKSPAEMTGVGTKWSTAIDEEGRIRSMVIAFSDRPVDRPYAEVERRAAAGLEYLKQRLVDEQAQLAEILESSGVAAPLWRE